MLQSASVAASRVAAAHLPRCRTALVAHSLCAGPPPRSSATPQRQHLAMCALLSPQHECHSAAGCLAAPLQRQQHRMMCGAAADALEAADTQELGQATLRLKPYAGSLDACWHPACGIGHQSISRNVIHTTRLGAPTGGGHPWARRRQKCSCASRCRRGRASAGGPLGPGNLLASSAAAWCVCLQGCSWIRLQTKRNPVRQPNWVWVTVRSMQGFATHVALCVLCPAYLAFILRCL